MHRLSLIPHPLGRQPELGVAQQLGQLGEALVVLLVDHDQQIKVDSSRRCHLPRGHVICLRHVHASIRQPACFIHRHNHITHEDARLRVLLRIVPLPQSNLPWAHKVLVWTVRRNSIPSNLGVLPRVMTILLFQHLPRIKTRLLLLFVIKLSPHPCPLLPHQLSNFRHRTLSNDKCWQHVLTVNRHKESVPFEILIKHPELGVIKTYPLLNISLFALEQILHLSSALFLPMLDDHYRFATELVKE
mmetsp:Transcript_38063/g.95333  ORF Transcript_38063/g.95333 Transcript_38063/m.95333 type:complete len:245 (+) Transcript_38063:753-1487(+)